MNCYGELGNRTTDISSNIPVSVYENDGYDGTNAVSVSCGEYHTGILLKTGKVLMFGYGRYGQLGYDVNNTSSSNIPVAVSETTDSGYDGTNAISISCGSYHSAILLNSGKVLMFGAGWYGQLGNGKDLYCESENLNSNIPVKVVENDGYDGTNAIMVKCGNYYTAILLNNGKVLTFGSNDYGESGNGTSGTNIPVAVKTGGNYDGTNAISISCGAYHSAILLNSGKVVTFGYGDAGALGFGGYQNHASPVSVDTNNSKYDGTNAINVECGNNYTIILLKTGELVSFGYNGYGTLGIGNTAPYYFLVIKRHDVNLIPVIF